ncbi:MAG: 2-oxoacid:acceptor oxidoreductase family protein [Nitrososphaerota archaeon]
MLKIRFHGRGGQGVKTSSRILGRAAFLDGYIAQDSPIYGAERRGAPVVAFTRISREPILERGYIFDPDIVIVVDETLLDDERARPLDGVKSGGIVFVNTQSEQAQVENVDDKLFIKYSITDAALRVIGKPIVSSPSAAAAAKITGIISKESIIQATIDELSELGLAEEALERNLRLVSEVFDTIPTPQLKILNGETTPREVIQLEYKGVIYEDIVNVGNASLRRVGNWRIFKPIVDYQKCTGCMLCFVYCPDSVISLDAKNKPIIDYENCKGCLICVKECPLHAITAVREVKIYA